MSMTSVPGMVVMVMQELPQGRIRLHTEDCTHAEGGPTWWFGEGMTDEEYRRVLTVYPHVEPCQTCNPMGDIT